MEQQECERKGGESALDLFRSIALSSS